MRRWLHRATPGTDLESRKKPDPERHGTCESIYEKRPPQASVSSQKAH